MINLNQLRVFYCVAKHLSFTKAAKELFITQPAVTAQVKQFEDWCDIKVFKKKGRGIHLTDAGQTLYTHACQIFEYEKRLENAIDDVRRLKSGVLRIGTTKTYVRYLMPYLIHQFQKDYPQIKVYLDEGSSLDMTHSLTQLRNEIAIITRVEDHPDIKFAPFTEEEVILILNPQHPLANKSLVTVEELAREQIIMREVGSGTRKFTDEYFKRNQCTPNILMETANTEFIKQLVLRGDGISFLVKESVIENLQAKILVTVPIEGGPLYLDTNIAYLKKQPLSPSAKAFIDTLDKLAKGKRPIKGIKSFHLTEEIHSVMQTIGNKKTRK